MQNGTEWYKGKKKKASIIGNTENILKAIQSEISDTQKKTERKTKEGKNLKKVKEKCRP